MPLPHPPSYYAATAIGLVDRAPLAGDTEADVCVVGGGFTGLSTALHLAEAGRSVVLIEANRVGWGASGRNGGQLHSGQRQDVATLERWFGRPAARALFGLAEEAKATVKHLIRAHEIDCDWRPGLIHAIHKRRWLAAAAEEVAHLRDHYGYLDAAVLDRDALAAAIGTDAYFGGWREETAGHLHPLNFALGLARAAEAAGVRIHEGTPALRLGDGPSPVVETPRGKIRAGAVVLATNGATKGLEPESESRIMPIGNYILTTEPLARPPIPGGEAVSDSRFVVYYWRPTVDGRLLFGGGETYSRGEPADIKAFVRRHMLNIYPGLADARIDHAWGGQVAVTMSRLPYMRRLRPGLFTSGGYSGQGVALATFAGKLMAEAILGDAARFDVMASLPARKFPGGRLLRYPSLVLAMSWYALRDRL
jgi:gamma-glutamylputrescine oxidase